MDIWKAIASIGICAVAVYGEISGIRFLFVGAIFICFLIWG